MRRIALALCLLAACALARAEDRWFSVHLDGRKIGHMLQSRVEEDGGRVRSRQLLSMTLARSGDTLTIQSEESTLELADGTPLAFDSRIDSAGSVTRVHGEIEHGHLRVAIEQPGGVERRHLVWPSDALLTEGQRLAMRRGGMASGTQFVMLAFDPGSLRASQLLTRVGAPEAITVHDRTERLVPLAQITWLDGSAMRSQAWVDPATWALRRLRFPAVGLQLDVLACDRACALAPVQPADVLDAMLVAAPRALRRGDLDAPLAYRLVLREGEGAALAAQPGQWIERDGGELRLRVDPAGDGRNPPVAADTAATRWLQSDAPAVAALAREAAGDARGTRARMVRLEAFVRGYIRTKSLRVGYASASEVLRDREGDCTEHAVLLAALARALGIPARVATGIAYTPAYGGRRDVFVPHAWVLAWVDGRWQGFDAALSGHDAGHIAFSSGDGDPFRFYEGLELLGAVSIRDVRRLGWRERAQLRRERAAR